MLYVGEGLRGSNGARSTLQRISVTPSVTHNQIGPLWCWFPSGWACACPRPLLVSPTTSPVRLGVSPAAAQPPRVFSLRGLRLYFVVQEPWVTWSALIPAVRLVYLCANVGPQGLLVVRLPARFVPHSASLGPARPRQCESSPLRLPVSAPPTGQDECLFFISLVSDFLVVRFSVSSGCERRHSVSTYVAILVLPKGLLKS